MAYTFDNPLRKLIHNPYKILGRYVGPGMKVLDIGCGMGYFSIAMAKMVGPGGSVISVDVQQKMLDIMTKRAEKAGVRERIIPRLEDVSSIGDVGKLDFALAFWVAHEITDKEGFWQAMESLIVSRGKLLVTEPVFHVSKADFGRTLQMAQDIGFVKEEAPRIALSRAMILHTPD